MGHPLRWYLPNVVYEVTSRTVQERFLLVPGPEARDLILGVLGRGLQLFPHVRLHAFAYMSNHDHLLASSDDGEQFARFVGYINGNVAREIGRLHGWRGPFWARRARPIPILDGDAIIARLRYIMSQGVKEGLVRSPREWPGASAVPGLLGEPLEGVRVNRELARRARHGRGNVSGESCAERIAVPLTPIPPWARLPRAALIARHLELVESIEDEADARPAGPASVQARSPLERPVEPARRSAPACHASSCAIREDYKHAYRSFVNSFRAAAAQARDGLADAASRFPVGCFPPGARYVRPTGERPVTWLPPGTAWRRPDGIAWGVTARAGEARPRYPADPADPREEVKGASLPQRRERSLRAIQTVVFRQELGAGRHHRGQSAQSVPSVLGADPALEEVRLFREQPGTSHRADTRQHRDKACATPRARQVHWAVGLRRSEPEPAAQSMVGSGRRVSEVTFRHDEGIRHLHDASFHELHMISAVRLQHEKRGVRDPDNLDLALPDADSLDQHGREEPHEQPADVVRCSGHAAGYGRRGLAPEIEPRLARREPHACAISEQSPPGQGARRIDGDDRHSLGRILDQPDRNLANQARLADARCAGEPDHAPSLTKVRVQASEESLANDGRLGSIVLEPSHESSDRALVRAPRILQQGELVALQPHGRRPSPDVSITSMMRTMTSPSS